MISIKIKDPLFTYHARLVNILDFNPKKLNIEKVCAIIDALQRIYYVKYDGDPFYLIIDDLKGYFKYSKEKVDGVNFKFSDYIRDRGVIRFNTDDALRLYTMVSVYSITIVIRSVYKTCCDRFYPQIYFKNCIYKKC